MLCAYFERGGLGNGEFWGNHCGDGVVSRIRVDMAILCGAHAIIRIGDSLLGADGEGAGQ